MHADDVADAYRRAVLSNVSGPFNIAADPVIGLAELSHLLDARPVRVPAGVLRAGAAATFWLRLHPAEPGWVDMALGVPLMSTQRAREALSWSPHRSSLDAIGELISGMREGAQDHTAPLARATSGPGRVREVLTGLEKRSSPPPDRAGVIGSAAGVAPWDESSHLEGRQRRPRRGGP